MTTKRNQAKLRLLGFMSLIDFVPSLDPLSYFLPCGRQAIDLRSSVLVMQEGEAPSPMDLHCKLAQDLLREISGELGMRF